MKLRFFVFVFKDYLFETECKSRGAEQKEKEKQTPH